MALLKDILKDVHIEQITGSDQKSVGAIRIDSRMVKAGDCFIAIKGVNSDGHQYISNAINAGASVIICEVMPSTENADVTYVRVKDSALAAGYIAHAFYGYVTRNIKLVGVTGTNGKTTISTLLFHLFSALGYRCGLISTVQYQIGDKILPSTHTTPDVIQLNSLLKEMSDQGCTHVFMECSSHAIHQQRIAGLHFTGAIFSNITHDHLDYHGSFDEYIRVKKSYFDFLEKDAFAISNLDDKRGEVMLQNTKAKTFYYSIKTAANFKGKIIENGSNGLHMFINEDEVHFRMMGVFNAYNLLAVYGAAKCLGEEAHRVLQVLSALKGADGRFDVIRSPRQNILGVVDYAHTPDALENILKSLLQLRKGQEQIITVVGCGGDRDKTKRPLMGQVAAEMSDRVLFTSDNPRSEDPQVILDEMQTDLTSASRRKVLVISDRKEAIKTAVTLADKGDVVLVAGKGHEKYQEIKGIRYDFDDKKVLSECFELLDK
jgi:UDP-N-acetylmuramoyl-L-alanyl-D-glutamate--2,6-diaminopimelate ligase